MLAESTRGNRVRDLPERIAIRPKNSAVLETRLHKPSILPKTFFRSLRWPGLGKRPDLWPYHARRNCLCLGIVSYDWHKRWTCKRIVFPLGFLAAVMSSSLRPQWSNVWKLLVGVHRGNRQPAIAKPSPMSFSRESSPTATLRAEDSAWALLNTPEFRFVP